MAGTLVLCGTPIGNLGDVSTRLVQALEGADLVYAEDTRRTGQLLNHLGVSKPMVSFFAGNEMGRLEGLRLALAEGKTVALLTDAGMPAVSDPGVRAVEAAVEVGAAVTAVPGPSAVTMAVALSGFDADRFAFEGFLPRKGVERTAALDTVMALERTVVLFAAPHRVQKDLASLAQHDPDRRVAVGRELTKLHEEVWRGTLGEAAEEFAEPDRARGEFTIVVESSPPAEPDMQAAVQRALSLISDGTAPSDAVRSSARHHGVSRRELYDLVMNAKD